MTFILKVFAQQSFSSAGTMYWPVHVSLPYGWNRELTFVKSELSSTIAIMVPDPLFKVYLIMVQIGYDI